MHLVFSTSLHPDSRSRILANVALGALKDQDVECELIDLSYLKPLPACNGHDCYSDPVVGEIAGKISAASGILLAAPIYNFDVSASCKNLIELTGSAWNEKVVGLLCAAGGQGSYMAPMGLLNSLMLDFRCLVLPKFVYATETAFENGDIVEPAVRQRLAELTTQLIRIGEAVGGKPAG